MINKILYGDNLKIMKNMEDELVDLIYLDPPFFTQTDWKNGDNEFSDNWKSMEEYIEFMKERIQEMHRVLKDTGSIYLHVDWHAVHYLKVEMDRIFGMKNFRNEIVWAYSGRENPRQKMFARKHDTILYYVKSNNFIFNAQFKKYRKEYIEQFFKFDDDDGLGLHRIQSDGRGGKYKQYINKSKGHPINDVWEDIKPLSFFGSQKERLGYPTQKPETLLERIIKASSNPDDVVLDPFCGSGTTLKAASKLGRKYIGIDENKQAVNICKKRIPKGLMDF